MPTENVTRTVLGSWSNSGTTGNGTTAVPFSSSGTKVAESIRTYRVSSNTPGFHNPNRSGPLMPRAFTFERDRNITRTGTQVTRSLTAPKLYGNTNGIYSGPITGTIDIHLNYAADTVAPVDLDSQCRNELLREIKGMKVNLANVYAERKKTADLVADTAMKLVSAVVHLKRGDIAGAAKAVGVAVGKRGKSRFQKAFSRDSAKALGSGWLQLQYGWKPLLNDVYGACEHLANVGNQPVVITTKKSRKRTTPLRYYERTTAGDQTSVTFEQGERKTTVKYGVTYYKPGLPSTDMASLGITNPLSVAWELTPWSFVVDWFYPVGAWIETFDATLGLTFHSGYRTLFSTSWAESIKSTNGVYAGHDKDWFSMSRVEHVRCYRTVLSDFPSPAIPRFKDPFSLQHMTNALALLSQTFGR